MVCGQIHAPATLPTYVHTHLLKSIFFSLPVTFETPMCLLFCQAPSRFVYLSRFIQTATHVVTTECNEKTNLNCHWLPLQKHIVDVVLEAEDFLVAYLALWWENDSVYCPLSRTLRELPGGGGGGAETVNLLKQKWKKQQIYLY
jgi:hypothetical protein